MTNKKTLAKRLSKRTLLNQKEANQIIEVLFEVILDELKSTGEVSIIRFGRFYLYTNTERPVRNPKTQEQIMLKPFRSVRFKQSNTVKKLLKNLPETDNE